LTLEERSNFIPIFENNQLYTSGYYTEIKNFVDLCELNDSDNYSNLDDLQYTYDLLTFITNYVQ